jgi:membrane protein DedA with SNARE-associated domain
MGATGLAADRHHGGVRFLGLPLSLQGALAVVQQLHHVHHVHPVHHVHHVVRRVHRFRRVRAGFDFVGLFLAAGVSWVALPGPGEAALVAASISAAHGHLDLTAVVAVAWAGASLGGIAGWIIGVKGGRTLLTAPGILRRRRLSLIARGDRFYERFGPIAVLFTPSWMAGIHEMRASRFLFANTLSALAWAVLIGAGAYLVGPSITDIVADIGVAGGILAGVLFVLAVLLVRRRSSARRSG